MIETKLIAGESMTEIPKRHPIKVDQEVDAENCD